MLQIATAPCASAYTALIGWQPSTGSATGYAVSVQYDGQTDNPPADVGLPPTEADGTIRLMVMGLPLGPTAYFSVLAYNDAGVFSAPSRVLAIDYAAVAEVVDSDGDGLLDADEDIDLDQLIDPGETDPNNPDTDGDGISDGDELDDGGDPTSGPPTTPPPTPDGEGEDLDNDGLMGATDPCPVDPRNLCVGPVAHDEASGDLIRINANVSENECTGQKIDCNGDRWSADGGYNQPEKGRSCDLDGGGEACVIGGIAQLFGCDDEETEDLFQCEHSDRRSEPHLFYDFAVADGTYVLNLYFANTYSGTRLIGERVFDIFAEGALLTKDFDQVAAAGGDARAVVRSYVIEVEDGNGLSFHFERIRQAPSVKAIELLHYDAPTQPPPTTPPDSTTTTTTTLAAVTTTTTTTTTLAPGATSTTTTTTTTTTMQPVSGCDDCDNDGLGALEDPCPNDPRNACYGYVATDRSYRRIVRINADPSDSDCAGSYRACDGNMWLRDFGYKDAGRGRDCDGSGDEFHGECVISGIEASFGCESAATSELFRCAHRARRWGDDLEYRFDVDDGEYLLNLMFANIHRSGSNAGDRLFDIEVEGTTAYARFDTVVAAGDTQTAVTRSVVVQVSDGNGLDITLRAVKGRVSINALELLQRK